MKKHSPRSVKSKKGGNSTKGKENQIHRYSMIVVSKYFNTINDYINLEKCCKDCKGIMEQFKYNPIPLKKKKERKLFKNIESYHFYGKQMDEQEESLFENEPEKKGIFEEEKEIIRNDKKIKKYVYWDVSYSYWKENKGEEKENEYKSVEYKFEDMKEHLFYEYDQRSRCYFRDWDRKKYIKTNKVELEEGITSIGPRCFSTCLNLQELNIPTSVTSLGKYCFNECSYLTKINIPTSVVSIGGYCFKDCLKLPEINIPTSVVSIEKYCFCNCTSLSKIKIPSSVVFIGSCCFGYYFDSNNNVEIEGNNEYYKKENMILQRRTEQLIHFYGSREMKEITIPTCVSSIGGHCFQGSQLCKLEKIEIPVSVKSFGPYCFFCSPITSINIPSSVSRIEKGCFYECSNLSTIDIPTSVSYIGKRCFEGCSNLRTITIPTSVSSFGERCFSSCSNLNSINIPTSVSSMGKDCFCHCSSLIIITIPSTISFIGDGCFSCCEQLVMILPDNIKDIKELGKNKIKSVNTIDEKNPKYETDGTNVYRKSKKCSLQ